MLHNASVEEQALGGERPADESAAGSVQVDAAAGAVTLTGEIDAALHRDLDSALEAVDSSDLQRSARLEVDVSRMTFIDSTGLKFLALLSKRSDQPVRVVRPSRQLRYLLGATQLSSLVDIVD